MSGLWKHTVESLVRKVKEMEIRKEELLSAFYKRIEKFEPKVHAFIHLIDENSIQFPEVSPTESAENAAILDIPFAVKDNLVTNNLPTTCGSKILWNYRGTYDATVVKRLKQAGGILIGKTNMDEFAMGSANEFSAFFKTRNPWDFNRIPGGSSGGSAAAVAAGFVAFALGSDTGGSIRLPASFCGIVGYKPSYGLVSRYGLVAFSSSLDQIGPLCRSVRDAGYIGNILIGKGTAEFRDKSDSTTVDIPMDLLEEIEAPISHRKIAVVKQFVSDVVDPQIKNAFSEAVNVFKNLGCTVEEIEFPEVKHVVAVYNILAPAEACSNLARFDGVRYGLRIQEDNLTQMTIQSRSKGFGEEVKRRILLGTFTLSSEYYDAYYKKAQRVRRLLSSKTAQLFERYDAMIFPTSPCSPFLIGEKTSPLTYYKMDTHTLLANLAGLPAISIPMGFANSLPCGLHIQCKPFEDRLLLNIARAYEKSAGFFTDQQYPYAELSTDAKYKNQERT